MDNLESASNFASGSECVQKMYESMMTLDKYHCDLTKNPAYTIAGARVGLFLNIAKELPHFKAQLTFAGLFKQGQLMADLKEAQAIQKSIAGWEKKFSELCDIIEEDSDGSLICIGHQVVLASDHKSENMYSRISRELNLKLSEKFYKAERQSEDFSRNTELKKELRHYWN